MNEITPSGDTHHGAWHWRVLRRFGAVPLQGPAAAPLHRLGRLAGSRTLVVVHRHDEPVQVAALLDALEWRDTLPGGLDRVVVLGERFAATIHDDLRGLNDAGIVLLRVLTGPGGLMRFAPLHRLLVHTVMRQPLWSMNSPPNPPLTERLTVGLKDYAAIGEHRGDAEAGGARSAGLSLIRGWGVDPQYDGQVFRPAWHCPPGPATPARMVQLDVPWQRGPRRVCVWAIDAENVETQVVLTARD